MMHLRKTMTVGLGAVFLIIGFTASAWGQAVPGPAMPFGGELEGAMNVKGSVVCVNCSLEDARKAQPDVADLYELTPSTPEHPRLVMKLDEVNNAFRWETLVGLSHSLSVRAEDRVWQALTAEENLFKQVEILGILSNNRTLDIGDVKIDGMTLSELEAATVTHQAMAASLRAQDAAARAETAALRAEAAASRAETIVAQTEHTVRRVEAMIDKLDAQRARL